MKNKNQNLVNTVAGYTFAEVLIVLVVFSLLAILGPIHFLESKKQAYENELNRTARFAARSLMEEINSLPFEALEQATSDLAMVPLPLTGGSSLENQKAKQSTARLILDRVNHLNIPLTNHFFGCGEFDERTMDLFVTPTVEKFVDPDGTIVLGFTLEYDYNANFKGMRTTHGGISHLLRTSDSEI